MSTQVADLARGAVVGHYEIEEPLASDGMATVYRARALETGEAVAIKRVPAAARAAALEIEARLLAHLSHPRVVAVRESFGDPGGAHNLVMQLIQGTDLARLLWDRGSPGLPVAEVLQHAHEACEALAYLHDQGVVHRDVKPRNLMLGERGVVLVDFGIAVHEGGDVRRGAGTPRFMAPEVFAGEPASPRSDVYGLAATAWTLLTGTPPAYGEDSPLAAKVPAVDAALEQALRGALTVDPQQRTASAEELASALGGPLERRRGMSLGATVEDAPAPPALLEAIVRAAAGVFDAAAASICLAEPGGGLRYVAAWGAASHEIIGVRLAPGVGIAGAVVAAAAAEAVPSCRTDPRFASEVAAGAGYVPHTMLVTPLLRDGAAIGALSVLDRRDGASYGTADLPRGALFAELAVAALG